MGMMTEAQVLTQLKKAQGETNERLDRLIAEQHRTNELLYWLATTVAADRISDGKPIPA
jgi:hypothetical protein